MFLENGYDDLEVIAAITSNELCEIGVNLPWQYKERFATIYYFFYVLHT